MRLGVYFPRLEDVHLGKDIGELPRLLHERHGVVASLITVRHGKYPSLPAGLDLHFIPSPLRGLAKHFMAGHRYDWFQVYHYTYESLWAAHIYRSFHPDGKLWLKLDTDCVDRDTPWSTARLLYKLAGFSLVTGEHEYIKTFKGDPVFCLPNPVRTPRIEEEKKPMILHAGRLGIPEKQSEMALLAFDMVRTKHPEWNLVLAGKETPEFIDYVVRTYPSLMDGHLVPMGHVSRDHLHRLMAWGSIILSPNRSESFGLGVVEALQQGCVLVGTDLPAYREHTPPGMALLSPVGDLAGLAENLDRAMSRDLTEPARICASYARERYSPEKIIDKLWERLGWEPNSAPTTLLTEETCQ